MKKVFSLDNWTIIKKISTSKRMAYATIYVKYPTWKMVAKLDLTDRKKFQNEFVKNNFQKLIDKQYFDTYEIVGNKKRPIGVEAKLTLASILKLSKLTFISNIFINELDGAEKKLDELIEKFFCVKMTVSIQIEGFTTGIQSCEDRYVLVKASSFENAYKKVKKQEKKYSEPYLNSDLRLVRWKIESYDDCYVTDALSIDDFNKPEGIEVFSKLRARKLTKERAWNNEELMKLKTKL
jgi:hypothetical protein